MRAGRLNDRIIIESKTSTIDSVGDPVDTWSTFATRWAEVKTNSGKEFLEAKEQHSSLSKIITLRYLSGVTTKMRVNHNGNYYNILAAFDPYNTREELHLYCDEQL